MRRVRIGERGMEETLEKERGKIWGKNKGVILKKELLAVERVRVRAMVGYSARGCNNWRKEKEG